ncbi:MAG: SulP family inorganic anion transporter [Neisseria sp.]|uniref:SulP family inorganic anion transporter n=1 Tax=Neisseria sp. TaxID=192066 RepID=UPI0026DB6682|nr:SulP family inorganic anion transporter [Neisseria sp.]MDO4640544.1 SulP family inorganic anion transporter [Neisseria sp.]
MRDTPFPSLLKTHFASGLVVFLVALPLCLGIALASGAPPLSGIISGIVGGIVVGLLSTSHVSVSGPAAGLTAIILASITELGSFELFLVAGLIAGICQVALGFARAGSIANYMPSAVIEGMLAGIGIIIIFKQLPYAVGYAGTQDSLLSHFSLSDFHIGSIIITIVSMAILIVWDKIGFLRNIKMLPAALIAVAAGMALNEVFALIGNGWAVDASQLVSLPVPESIDDFKNILSFPDFSGFAKSSVWVTGLTIAVVASIETLLCIEAADRIDRRRRITDTNQELRAQGVGNILSALIGGLPMTSVIVRTSANVNAGATHKLSAVIHGVLLLVCVASIPAVLNKIPLATLAAVLILVGYKLAKPATLVHFWHKGKYQFMPFVMTMIAVVCLDLLKGVALGLLVSIVFILQGNMKRAYYLSREELAEADKVTLELSEEVSFLNKAAIKKTLKNIRPGSTVEINARRTTYIATDVLELIEDFTNVFARENNITVMLRGFKGSYESVPTSKTNVKVEHKRRI